LGQSKINLQIYSASIFQNFYFMQKINASIVIPSHRSDTSTIRHLISTIDLFLQHGFEVVIADNSGSAKKSQQLRAEFVNDLVFANTEVDCDALDNFLAGFNTANDNYVLFVSDDDIFLPTGVQALAHAIKHSAEYEGFCAPVVHHAQKNTTISNPPNLTSQNLTECLIAWACCDTAVSFYGCYSKKIGSSRFRGVATRCSM
jgi:glycosyltransferase involved in cell wall biosynthesis